MSSDAEVIINTESNVAGVMPDITVHKPDNNEIIITIDEKPKLTAEQQKIIKTVYDTAKNAMTSILINPNMGMTIKITQSIGHIVKLVEGLKINNNTVSGHIKKLVAIEVGRQVIIDVIKDEKLEADILTMYDNLAEMTIETLIDVSNNVNVNVPKVTTTCFTAIMTIFSRRMNK
jgi:hypothetical protein